MQQDPNAVLEDYRGWLRKVAAGMTRPDLVEDLAQEGWVAMWRALHVFDPTRGALPAWLTYRAAHRMRECIGNRAWLGRPRRHLGRGRISDATEYPAPDDASVWERLVAPDVFDAVLWGYHTGEILAAIDRLSPAQRRYVHLRFWVGLQTPELTKVFGYDPHGLWTSPETGARNKLRASLASLRG